MSLYPSSEPAIQLESIYGLEPDIPQGVVSDLRPTRRYQALLLISGFFMTFQTIGINQSYGIFQEFYTSPSTNIPSSIEEDAIISLVGSIGYGLTWSGSIFVNVMLARIVTTKYITIAGAFIMSLGLFLASYSTKLWHLFLTQALIFGVGASMFYFPIMSLTPLYFDKHRAFAMGVILAGSGIGGLFYAPIIRLLIEQVGIQWTLRTLGMINLTIGIPVASIIKQHPSFSLTGSDRSTRLSRDMVQRWSFWLQAFGAFLQAAGNLVPTYYLTTYSTSVLLYSASTASLLLAVNSGVNSLARVLMGLIADKIGRQNTMCISVLSSAVSVIALWYNAAPARFIAFVVIYAIYAGGYNALVPVIITEIYGTQNYKSVNGMLYFIRGLGAIAGAPIAGIVLGSHKRGIQAQFSAKQHVGETQASYNTVVVYDTVILIAAGACVSYVRWLDAKNKGVWKWKA